MTEEDEADKSFERGMNYALNPRALEEEQIARIGPEMIKAFREELLKGSDSYNKSDPF